MKRFLKISSYILGVIFMLAISFATYIQLRGIPTYEPITVDLNVDVTPERVANGLRIATMQCQQCHASGNVRLTGRFMNELPKAFGKIYSKNITHDSVKGIGDWTDGELFYFLRTGVRANGTYAPPYMPKFPLMADEDLKDVIAWLRSDSYDLQASESEPPESVPSFLIKILTNTMIRPLPYSTLPILKPDTTNMVKLGEYYANGVAGCFTCHSADLIKVDVLSPAASKGYYGGGSTLFDMDGNEIISRNITFDDTGIAHYSEDEFTKTVRYGQKPDGTMVRYPMVPHTTLTDREVRAIYAFLKTVPKIKNEILN